MAVLPSTFTTDHAEAPPVGSVEYTILPTLSTARQNEAVGQEMAFMELDPSTSTTDHAEAPPVGSVEYTISPAILPAAQNEVVGQDTDVILLV
jgi:hypothetical protein